MTALAILIAALLTGAAAWAAPVDEITPRVLPIPAPTEWKPVGCRTVPFEHPVLLPRTAFRRAHADLESSDEVALAYPPVYARDWVAETSLYQVTTPSFDSAGNIYMSPLLPHEPILIISLDPQNGARRFVVPRETGQRGGGVVPMVLRDPESGGEVVYMNAYQQIVAVRTDGTPLWSVPTGLGAAVGTQQSPIGLAWVPNADAIIGLTVDGFVVLHDRRTGAPLMPPLQLPGERTPPRPSTIPPALAEQVDALLEPLVAFTEGNGVLNLIEVLLGGSNEVANNLSVDGRNNRLWIASSSRDAEDGTVDGVSEFGALYRFDVVRDGDSWRLAEICHRNFSGGSASTPTLALNNTRVYLGDDAGGLLAINAENCSEAWTVPLNSQIFGSVAASSDGREIYASSADGIFQVFDDGGAGRRGWTAELDLYDLPPDLAGYVPMNLLLAGAGANGLLIQTGVGLRPGAQAIPVRTGIALVDRLTGQPRWFADGLEESLAAMSTGPDGVLYLSHSPLRRAFAVALGLSSDPPLGGMSKWSPTRHDLLAREAACAAADRAANARAVAADCPDSAAADMVQVDALRLQLLDAVAAASSAGEIDDATAGCVDWLATRVGAPPSQSAITSARQQRQLAHYHRKAARGLGRACRVLTSDDASCGAGGRRR